MNDATVEERAPGAQAAAGGAIDATRVLVIDDSNTIRRSAETPASTVCTTPGR